MQIHMKVFLGVLVALAILSVVTASDPNRPVPDEPTAALAFEMR